MPLLLHCLDSIRVNSYVLYKEISYLHPAVNDDLIKNHKEFLIEFINSLILCACNEDIEHSVTQQATPVGDVEPSIHLDCTRELRFSTAEPPLSTFDHVQFLPGEHKLIEHKQRKCKHCQYLVAVARVNMESLPEEGRPLLGVRIVKLVCVKITPIYSMLDNVIVDY